MQGVDGTKDWKHERFAYEFSRVVDGETIIVDTKTSALHKPSDCTLASDEVLTRKMQAVPCCY